MTIFYLCFVIDEIIFNKARIGHQTDIYRVDIWKLFGKSSIGDDVYRINLKAHLNVKLLPTNIFFHQYKYLGKLTIDTK